jgi:hypothetical protein
MISSEYLLSLLVRACNVANFVDSNHLGDATASVYELIVPRMRPRAVNVGPFGKGAAMEAALRSMELFKRSSVAGPLAGTRELSSSARP